MRAEAFQAVADAALLQLLDQPHGGWLDELLDLLIGGWWYSGLLNWDRTDEIDPCAPHGARISGLSRAVMRLDGFVSADALFDGGERTTVPLVFEGNRLLLNVDTSASGAVRTELLDESGRPIEGLSGPDSPWLIGNSVRLPVPWKDPARLRPWQGKPVRLRFAMYDCKLYAFLFEGKA